MRLSNLYLSIIPIVHLGQQFGLTEEVMTLFPDPQFGFSLLERDGFAWKNQGQPDLP